MKKKIFTILLALAACVGASHAAPAVAVNGKLPGAFSVSATKKVCFSQGNLRFTRTSTSDAWSTGKFSFMDNQYDYIETSNVSGDYASQTAIGLFGWATSNINTPKTNTYYYPWETDNSNDSRTKYGSGITTAKVNWSDNDNAFANYDWGANTGDLGTGWRTLTKDEWVYLFNTRTNASNLRTWATVNSVPGMILMPDGWIADGVSLTIGTGFGTNDISTTNWATLEGQGCVFLPAAGCRRGTSVSLVGEKGYYWSSTSDGGMGACDVLFIGSGVNPADASYRRDGFSVRLVSDIPTSGSCGNNLTWEFNTETGALTISGTGAMYDYSWDPNAAPWYAYKDAITSVSFPEGITTIGAYAFVNCDNAAFTTVTIPEGVITLGVNAFYNCDGIQEITIPSTVTTIEVGAIYDCKAVNSITSYIASPTNLHGYAIYGYKNTCTLYVPYNSIADYQAADCWKYIPNIAAIPGTEPAAPANVDIIPNVDPENPTVYYSTFYDSEVKYLLPENVEAYIVTTVSGDAMQLQKVAEAGQTIPAGAGVIFKASVTPFTLTPSDAEAVSVAGNRLEASDASIATPANCYVLSCENNLVGFYHYTAGNLNAHKAYIYSGSNQAPRRLRFVFDQATGVENVQGNVQITKVFRDGQLVIIRNGIEYNAAGQMVK